MKRLKEACIALALVFGLSLVPAAPLHAEGILDQSCKGVTNSSICKSKNEDGMKLARDLINGLLTVLGFIAVLVIIAGGIKYVTSDGDSGKIKGAKDTIMYAVIGLIVAAMSFAIVNFIVGRF